MSDVPRPETYDDVLPALREYLAEVVDARTYNRTDVNDHYNAGVEEGLRLAIDALKHVEWQTEDDLWTDGGTDATLDTFDVATIADNAVRGDYITVVYMLPRTTMPSTQTGVIDRLNTGRAGPSDAFIQFERDDGTKMTIRNGDQLRMGPIGTTEAETIKAAHRGTVLSVTLVTEDGVAYTSGGEQR